MANAPGSGTETLRDLEGSCDWCGDDCHPNSELCVVMSCNRCDDAMIYHQGCLEKFLKKYGFPSNRKVGFPCPKGRGKGTQYSKECLGRIDRSHPIIPKNEEKKKKALPPPIAEVMGKSAAKQPGKSNGKVQQAAKPGLPARKLAQLKPYELSMRFGASTNSAGSVPNAWHRAEGVNLAVREAPTEFVESAYTIVGADQPKPSSVPVGLVLEEALTKAQKKNLARRKKKHAAIAADGQHGEAGTTVTYGSANLNSLEDWAAAEQLRYRPGSSVQVDENLLAGHNKFITNPARYLQLLGLLSDDSDADSEDEAEGDQDPQLTPADTPVLSFDNSSDSPGSCSAASVDAQSATSTGDNNEGVPVVVPIAIPLVLPAALQPTTSVALAMPTVTPVPALAMVTSAAHSTEVDVDEDAALLEALELSRKQYELEQEIQKQQLVLAGGLQGQTSIESTAHVALAPQAGIATLTPLSFTFSQASTSTPLVIAPFEHDNAPIVLPKVEVASLKAISSGSGPLKETVTELFRASNVGQPSSNSALPLSRPTNGYAPVMMATSQRVSTLASTEEDDDLTDLMALCGVAG